MGKYLDEYPSAEEVDLLSHVVAKFTSGALAGLPEAAARRLGMGDVFEAKGATGLAGVVADLAGFTIGAPQKAISLALRGTKSTSTLGQAVEQAVRLGGFGAAYSGAQALVGGGDIGKRVLEEAPVWAAFGAGGPLLSGAFRKVFPKLDKLAESTTGLGEEALSISYRAPNLLTYQPRSEKAIRLQSLFGEGVIPLPERLAGERLPYRVYLPERVASKPTVDLFDSSGRKVEEPGFLLSAEELLAKRRAGKPVSILYDQSGKAYGASATEEIKLWEPTFKPRSTRTQAELVKHRMNEVEEFRARLFPKRPLGAKLARAKISGKADEVSAVAGELRSLEEDQSLVESAKAGSRLPSHINLPTGINPVQLYEVTFLSADELPMTITIKGSLLKSALSSLQARIMDVKPKAEPAGFADIKALGEGYKNLGLPVAPPAANPPIKQIEGKIPVTYVGLQIVPPELGIKSFHLVNLPSGTTVEFKPSKHHITGPSRPGVEVPKGLEGGRELLDKLLDQQKAISLHMDRAHLKGFDLLNAKKKYFILEKRIQEVIKLTNLSRVE